METLFEEALLDWPAPPYPAITPQSKKTGPEACLIYLLDGGKMLGDLIHFSPDQPNIVFRPARRESNQTVDLDRIKSVWLTRPMALRRDKSGLETRAKEIIPRPDKQPYAVKFADDQVMEGDTVGYADLGKGLYLFLPTEGDKIVRCFIPKTAIASYQVGPLIGEMLIEEELATSEEVAVAMERQGHLRRQRIGEYLAQHEIVSRDQLAQAIRHQESRPILKLGEALLQLELLTREQLDAALAKQQQNRKLPLGRILVEMGVVDERTLQGVLAKKLCIPFVGLSKFDFDPNAILRVKATTARKYVLMPLCIEDDTLVVAFENPLDALAIEELRFLTQAKIQPVMASRQDILAAIGEYYDAYGAPERLREMSAGSAGQGDFEAMETAGAEAHIGELASMLFDQDVAMEAAEEPVAESDSVLVQLVNKMILDAHRGGVSDIHIETYPGKQNTRVRFRKDGTLVDYLEIPANFRNAVISRIKIMAQLDISERRRPQDGKFDFRQFGPARIELRVAAIPTANGLEDIVLRVLSSARPMPMDELGLTAGMLATLQKIMLQPYGLVLVCGPTGSGKTTTLHSMLGHINTPGRKIWTAEDPIEITQAGLRQVQVNAKIGWTFSRAMRSFVRADPDVIMVGEMRDAETAKIAIEASLTGHLVLSTLHTNGAPESVLRLLDLGMDPFNFADALVAVLAQRLAKALCTECRQAYQADPGEIEAMAAEYCLDGGFDPAAILRQWQDEYAHNDGITLYRATGCPRCGHTGYRGRLGLHELLLATPPIKQLIQARAPMGELLRAAFAGGMRTLKQDGLAKVLQGRTDVTQVRAVCG